MGIPNSSILDLIEKVRSWISWEGSDLFCFSSAIQMSENNHEKMCCHCNSTVADFNLRYHCQRCKRVLCGNCRDSSPAVSQSNDAIRNDESSEFVNACKFCVRRERRREYSEKIYPSASPRQSPVTPLPSCFNGERFDGANQSQNDRFASLFEAGEFSYSSQAMGNSSVSSSTCYPSPGSAHRSPIRSDEDEAGNSMKHFFRQSSEYYDDISDIDSSSFISAKTEFHSFKSLDASPLDSPPRPDNSTSHRIRQNSVQQERQSEYPENTDEFSDHLSIFRDQYEKIQKPLDFENNGLIWFPPPPDDENDEAERNFFEYDDEDDDIGDSGEFFSSSSIFPSKEKQNMGHKEPLKAVVQGHFRALVAQLLQGEGIMVNKENRNQDWLDVVTSVAWQAANFVKTDASRGGSMDPGDYVKVKCIASGSPSESTLIKGVVCTKNIKHKRMTSQYKNPRLLLLGGALEYQRVPNELASFDKLLQQEIDHLKIIVSRIEAHRTNVLLVEKSVSSYAQDYLLAKDISLVLNVKRPLLERIARCTGASITSSVDSIPTTRLGHCELFRLERVSEEFESSHHINKKPSKTLMFFEGCPRRLGCTVLLKGTSREELKKVKHVVQYAIFAAYHLSLETSFLADEGATLPKLTIKPSARNEGFLTRNLECKENLSIGNGIAASHVDSIMRNCSQAELCGFGAQEECQKGKINELNMDRIDENDISSDYLSAAESKQSILVSFSSRCVTKGTVCERSRLLRIKFYGCFDKPLGRYLLDDLFDQDSCCSSCKQPSEAHVLCFTHQQGSLTINVKRLSSLKLPGERDGKIWMWHRCLKCSQIDGIPPSTRRVVMSDSAWGLSFGKFLELSFSNHATANRIAGCGHSLQKDCLRYYGFGSMVAFFRYSPVDILSVRLPPSVLEFNGHSQQDWMRKEELEFVSKVEALYTEITDVLNRFEQKSISFAHKSVDTSELHKHIMDLKDQLAKEKDDYNGFLKPGHTLFDIFELNSLRRSLMIGSHFWDRQLYSLDSLLKTTHPIYLTELKELNSSISFVKDEKLDFNHEENIFECRKIQDLKEEINLVSQYDEEITRKDSVNLSEKIDSAWTGTDQLSQTDISNPFLKRIRLPIRVNSFDSALISQEKFRRKLSSSSFHLSTLRSFHASGDFRNMVRDQVSDVHTPNSQKTSYPPSFISSASNIAGGARLLLTQEGHDDLVIAVYDDEPTSAISYTLSCKDYANWVGDKLNEYEMMNSVYPHHYKSEESPHMRISFGDESLIGGGKVRFSVTCFFAKQFDELREKCCNNKLDFVRSLSRCKRWSAQGGKSNVYFAKSLDERFIIKQVTKTELDSFEEFAAEYFKYLRDSLRSGSPTCLAKILGIYQVNIKFLKSGKETKMDLMVMENLFFNRSISRVYDLKGSVRSRYNADTTGTNNVLLDMNLLETLRTKPIFLGSKAKRSLERAVWNDTSFLASNDVMDYSLLVGVDEERKELVLGIIDYMRQYTWDKHLENWVKASGILGGPKNASPTIISPKQYKRRFRKAMTTYFLTVPDQWSS